MKELLLIIFCGISFLGNSQDILFLRNKEGTPVEIIKIDSSAALVEYNVDKPFYT